MVPACCWFLHLLECTAQQQCMQEAMDRDAGSAAWKESGRDWWEGEVILTGCKAWAPTVSQQLQLHGGACCKTRSGAAVRIHRACMCSARLMGGSFRMRRVHAW